MSAATYLEKPKPSSGERREAARHRRNLRAEWRLLGTAEADFVPARVLDISISGIALFVDPPLRRGQILVVKLDAAHAGLGPWVMRITRTIQQPNNTWLVGCSFARRLTESRFRALLDAVSPKTLLPATRKPTPAPKVVAESPDEPGSCERRNAPRRPGATVTVALSHPHSRTPHLKGWVQDRSLGGLGVCASAAVKVGTKLKIHATTAPKDIPAVAIRVVSCRAVGKEWLLGCQFLEAPPTKVMYFFG
jgi:hypothetical protein